MTLVASATTEQYRTLAADVLLRLRNDIVTCHLKPGGPLRFEALKETYGASFSTLREGLTALISEGLVTSEGQRGFRVATVSQADLLDLTESRVFLERHLIRLAIENGSDDWEVETAARLHRMSLLEQRLGANFAITPDWKRAHQQFHEAIVAASRSPILLAMRATLFARSERYRSLSTIHRKVKRDKIEEHRVIMEAAFARKIEKAQSLIDNHIRATTANVLKFASAYLEIAK